MLRRGNSCVLLSILGGICRPVLHTRFQTWPLGRNYVIITQIRAETKKLFKSTPQFPRKPYPIPDQTGQAYTRFQTKTTQNPARWGCRNLYSLYKEVSLPRVSVFFILKISTITREFKMSKEGPTVYKTPMLACFSQRQRIQPFNSLAPIARNDFSKFNLQ